MRPASFSRTKGCGLQATDYRFERASSLAKSEASVKTRAAQMDTRGAFSAAKGCRSERLSSLLKPVVWSLKPLAAEMTRVADRNAEGLQ